MTTETANIHRFRDAVALSLPGDGETIYLTAEEAARLSDVLSVYARDVEQRGFVASDLHGCEIALSNPTRS